MASIASAKTYQVNPTVAGEQVGAALDATITDPPLGKCPMTGKLVIPDTLQIWTCNGGTIKITGPGTTGAANNAKGTWKITGGTRKFKSAKGGGTFAGLLSTASSPTRARCRSRRPRAEAPGFAGRLTLAR